MKVRQYVEQPLPPAKHVEMNFEAVHQQVIDAVAKPVVEEQQPMYDGVKYDGTVAPVHHVNHHVDAPVIEQRDIPCIEYEKPVREEECVRCKTKTEASGKYVLCKPCAIKILRVALGTYKAAHRLYEQQHTLLQQLEQGVDARTVDIDALLDLWREDA